VSAAPLIAAGREVRVAAGPRDDFAELVRALPRDGERADGAAALPGDRAAGRIVAELHRLFRFGEDFLQRRLQFGRLDAFAQVASPNASQCLMSLSRVPNLTDLRHGF